MHADGGLPTIPGRKNAKLKTTEANYSPNPGKFEITLRPGTRHPAFNVVHEIGHFIDHHGLGSGGFGLASVDEYPAVKQVIDAIQASPEVKSLRKETNRAKAGPVKTHLNYLGQTAELFARAYSQYIAIRGQDPEIRSALRYEQSTRFGKMTYWNDASFEPIAERFDAMFREVGWSHD